MWVKLKSKSSLFTLVLLFSLLTPQIIFPLEKKSNEIDYARLIKIYNEWSKLENETFEMLSFKPSLTQLIKEGTRLKLMLEDNLGKKWMFKPDFLKKQGPKYAQGEIATIVYRVYKLFGVDTPRTHFITLNINDKEIFGGMQEYIPNKGTLRKHTPAGLSPEALNYLLKSQVLDWLLANHDTSRKHFLITSLTSQNKPKKIIRIDNDAALRLSENDELRYDWKSDHFTKISSNYYFKLWQSYLAKEIDLNMDENLIFVDFISNFPDDFFLRLILLVETQSSKEILPFDLEKNNQSYNSFLKSLLSRKNSLTEDFKKFYKDLAEKKEIFSCPHKNIDNSKIINSIIQILIKEIKSFKEIKSQLKKAPIYSPNINALSSFEGFSQLRKVYYAYWKKEKKNLSAVCDSALERLCSLKASTENKYEKEALKIYIKDIKSIHSGKPAIFRFSETNKIIP